MKIREYLLKLDKSNIKVIGNNLEVIDEFDKCNFSKKHMIDLIIRDRLLNREYLYNFLDNKGKVKFNCNMLEIIKRITFGLSVESEEYINLLEECGFIYNKRCMPEDLRVLLIDKYRKEVIVNIEDPVLYNKHTPFLKLTLFTSRIFHDGKIKKDTGKNHKYIRLIISYLFSKNLVVYVEDKYMTLNIDNYNKWYEGEKEIIKEFYDYFFANINKLKVKELLYNLMSIQLNREEWIEVGKIKWLLKDYEEETYFAIDIGLIVKAKDKEEYIQLNNEVWIMFGKYLYNESNNEENVVTPDSEVYIPYKDDPLFILIFSHFGKLINEFCNDDYFLIFDISENIIKNTKIGNYTYKEFLGYLKTKCSYIPDLVNEQLKNLVEISAPAEIKLLDVEINTSYK